MKSRRRFHSLIRWYFTSLGESNCRLGQQLKIIISVFWEAGFLSHDWRYIIFMYWIYQPVNTSIRIVKNEIWVHCKPTYKNLIPLISNQMVDKDELIKMLQDNNVTRVGKSIVKVYSLSKKNRSIIRLIMSNRCRILSFSSVWGKFEHH